MTTVLDPATDAAEPAAPKRRWWLRAAIGTVVLILVGGGIGWAEYINHYQPLLNTGELRGRHGALVPISDGVADTYLILRGAPGVTGVSNYTITNDGPFAVKLLGLDPELAGYITSIQWGPARSVDPADPSVGPPVGSLSRARDFPVTVAPHDEVILHVKVTQPLCRHPGDGNRIVSAVPIRWSALGVHHLWYFVMDAADQNLPLLICPTKLELSHVVRF